MKIRRTAYILVLFNRVSKNIRNFLGKLFLGLEVLQINTFDNI
jgi:hypothetical protein